MKRQTMIISGALAIGATMPSWAVIDGEPLVWAVHDNTVLINGCTGTLIGGQYVLTAAHCQDDKKFWSIRDSTETFYSNLVGNTIVHPEYIQGRTSIDVAFAKLTQPLNYQRIQFFKNLNAPTFVEGNIITLDGFGGTGTELHRGEFVLAKTFETYPFYIRAAQTNNSHTTNGDSGAAWVDSSGMLAAVHKGSSVWGSSDDEVNTYGTDLHYASDFILETVNGWHYPTVAKINGQSVIEVQSLHVNGAGAGAYTEGDATIVEQSCNGAVEAYQRCTYTVESNGGSAKLVLSGGEVVNINPKSVEPTNPGDSSSSGGSLGFVALLALVGVGLRRR